MILMMPLTFVSSAFAPLHTMPGLMRVLANGNPVSHATDALRGVVLGTAKAGDVTTLLLAAIVMWAAVTAVPATRK